MAVARTDTNLLAGVSNHQLLAIAGFVAKGGLREGREGREDREGREAAVERVWSAIRAMRGVSLRFRAITIEALRPALALVMRVALPQTLSTRDLLWHINADPELSRSLGLDTARTEVESVAILSRLVDLSRAGVAARAVGAEKLNGLIVRQIESARPALLASLERAEVHLAAMYADPRAVAHAAIERLKHRPYDRIVDALTVNRSVRSLVSEFVRDRPEERGRAAMIDLYGPLCLWDVSGVADLAMACTPLQCPGFNSDLFWNTKSATNMSKMFFGTDQFKGHIGTWDVSGVRSMGEMFFDSAIEDSGIANWNTASLVYASGMFHMAHQLSDRLDLSAWVFGDNVDMTDMFRNSRIVDCGIGTWKVASANTRGMLTGATRFTGHASLANWPPKKLKDAEVPKVPAPLGVGSAGVGFGSAGVSATEARHSEIARLLADGLRTPRGSQGPGASERRTKTNPKRQKGQETCAVL
jgi:hypothetical protein